MWECRTIARSPAVPSSLRPADGKEVERAVEVPAREAKVGGGDRGREAVVERLRQPEPLVDAVPTELQRPAVDAQLARVEEPEQLDLTEVRRAEPTELGRPVLLDVPRVVGLPGPLRRQGQQGRGGDIGDARGR